MNYAICNEEITQKAACVLMCFVLASRVLFCFHPLLNTSRQICWKNLLSMQSKVLSKLCHGSGWRQGLRKPQLWHQRSVAKGQQTPRKQHQQHMICQVSLFVTRSLEAFAKEGARAVRGHWTRSSFFIVLSRLIYRMHKMHQPLNVQSAMKKSPKNCVCIVILLAESTEQTRLRNR